MSTGEELPLRREEAPPIAWDGAIVPQEADAAPVVDPQPEPPRKLPRQRVLLPALLFVVTCYTTYDVGGPWFSFPLMFTLLCHEFGHYIQARRYGVPVSLPWFIPLPKEVSLFGTMGAVIGMRGRMPNRKALFDIGITGPIAGLGPAIAFSLIGLWLSKGDPFPIPKGTGYMFGDSILFRFFTLSIIGPIPDGFDVNWHPMAFAGWVGLFVTALNLVPIGQLDGGHVLYALIGRYAHPVTIALYLAAIIGMAITQTWMWALMLVLLGFMGPRHPPTHDDADRLGRGRVILGWLMLLFFLISFTPDPIQFLD